MQELRLVAVSEDGSYAILAVPGRSGRFLLPIDDRLRTVAKGQFSRLAQYEIEVENPLRPKEIQDRIRAGETADEIADAAGIPPDRVRRFEGPVLAERQYRAQEAQRATIPGHSDSGPGPRLGDVVADRLARAGARSDSVEWDTRKRSDGNWQLQLQFSIGGRTGHAEWVYDPRRKHVMPDDDQATRLCLPQSEWTGLQPVGRGQPTATATATVTPIGARQSAPRAAPAAQQLAPPEPSKDEPAEPASQAPAAAPEPQAPASPPRKAASSRARRASMPSWDEIMFGTSRQTD